MVSTLFETALSKNIVADLQLEDALQLRVSCKQATCRVEVYMGGLVFACTRPIVFSEHLTLQSWKSIWESCASYLATISLDPGLWACAECHQGNFGGKVSFDSFSHHERDCVLHVVSECLFEPLPNVVKVEEGGCRVGDKQTPLISAVLQLNTGTSMSLDDDDHDAYISTEVNALAVLSDGRLALFALDLNCDCTATAGMGIHYWWPGSRCYAYDDWDSDMEDMETDSATLYWMKNGCEGTVYIGANLDTVMKLAPKHNHSKGAGVRNCEFQWKGISIHCKMHLLMRRQWSSFGRRNSTFIRCSACRNYVDHQAGDGTYDYDDKEHRYPFYCNACKDSRAVTNGASEVDDIQAITNILRKSCVEATHSHTRDGDDEDLSSHVAGSSSDDRVDCIQNVIHHHHDPPAQRDESLLQLQADEEWSTLVERSLHAPGPGEVDDASTCDVPASEKIWLLQYASHPQEMYDALVSGLPLRACRDALGEVGHSCVLPASGAKVFVKPEQWDITMSALQTQELRPYHVIVAESLEYLVEESLSQIRYRRRPKLKSGIERVLLQTESTSSQDNHDWIDEAIEFLQPLRTFLCVVRSLRSESSVVQSTIEHYRAIPNPRRYYI